MGRIWANRIWAGTKTFEELHTKAPRYEAATLEAMREDVADGLHTPEEFEEKTGIPYEPEE